MNNLFIILSALIVETLAVTSPYTTEETAFVGFKKESAQVDSCYFERLESLTEFLKDHKRLVIEVSGHRSMDELPGICIARANAVRTYLITNGIKENKLVAADKDTTSLFFKGNYNYNNETGCHYDKYHAKNENRVVTFKVIKPKPKKQKNAKPQ
jgi:hypothetical protein